MFTKADIEKYFTAEKQGSLVFMVIGIAGIVLALVLLIFLKTSFYKGASIPFLLIGLLAGIIGFTIYKKSDGDRIRNVYAYDMNPGELKGKELPRMEKVMKSFMIYRYTEIFLFLAGACLYIYFIRDIRHDFWRGLGLALSIMALLALTVDHLAEKRGRKYFDGIKTFTAKF
jgi:drug/metabolite transporter (DMT)-like permease